MESHKSFAIAWLIPSRTTTRLQHAMHYSLNTGGKHLRGSLLHWVGAHGGASCEACDAPALAIELMHAYSLVHDDLPCMDDDHLRRGQPSCHKQFDEATALLVGDALQSKAFELLSQSNPHLQATQQVALVHALAQAIGDLGMAEGQSQDLQQHPEGIAHTHALKTAALFQAALKMGCIVAQLSPTQTENLSQAGFHFGMTFQWDDDLQD